MRKLWLLRTVSGILVPVLVALATGVPHEPATDHDGHQAHVEIDHGGHGATLVTLDQPLRVSKDAMGFIAIPAAAAEWNVDEIAAIEVELAFAFPPRSRPPPSRYSRAPPLL